MSGIILLTSAGIMIVSCEVLFSRHEHNPEITEILQIVLICPKINKVSCQLSWNFAITV